MNQLSDYSKIVVSITTNEALLIVHLILHTSNLRRNADWLPTAAFCRGRMQPKNGKQAGRRLAAEFIRRWTIIFPAPRKAKFGNFGSNVELPDFRQPYWHPLCIDRNVHSDTRESVSPRDAMAKKTIRDLQISGKRLLVRVDFNVVLRHDGNIATDRRIRAALPTIRYCLERDASLILMTHLGRPRGRRNPKLGLQGVAHRLQEFLRGANVELVEVDAPRKAGRREPSDVVLLENLRFDPGEESGDEQFAHRLRQWGDIYVNDVFTACQRTPASLFAVPKLFPHGSRVIGLLVEKELRALDSLLESPRQPMVAILGGARAADKIGVIPTLLHCAQKLLIGGALAFTFMKARGLGTGLSRIDDDRLDLARRLIDRAGDKLVLPQDHVVARRLEAPAETRIVEKEIPDGWYGLDIGPKTIERYTAAIRGAATVLWNGPLGKFEDELFRQGTESIVRALAENDAITIVGGGESEAAVEQFGLVERIDHVSTGGGAFLEYLKQGTLPALTLIDEWY